MKNNLDVSLPKIKKVKKAKKPSSRAVKSTVSKSVAPRKTTKKSTSKDTDNKALALTKIGSILSADMDSATTGERVPAVKATISSPIEVAEHLSASASACVLKHYSDFLIKKALLSGVTDPNIKRAVNKTVGKGNNLAEEVRAEVVTKSNTRITRIIDRAQKKAVKDTLTRADLKEAGEAIKDIISPPTPVVSKPKKAAAKKTPAKKAATSKRKRR